MKKIKKIFVTFMAAAVFTVSIPAAPQNSNVLTAEAHSGRTDSSGGHHDYRNASGLGFYHYHCGGHPAHLHPNGVCPYSNSGSSSSGSSSRKIKLKISKKKLSLVAGNNAALKLNIRSSKATWKSSNKKVASVSKKGIIKAKKAGKTTITAKYNGQTVKCKVTVKKPEDVVIKTVNWDDMDNKVQFKITNNTNKPIIVQQELKAYDYNYHYFNSMYLTTASAVIPAKSTRTVVFYDTAWDDIIYDTQQFAVRINVKGIDRTCYALYTGNYEKPYKFIIKQ